MSILLLLLGPGSLRRERWLFLALGLLLVATGGAVALRAPDDLTLAVLEAAGWIVVASGIARLAFFALEIDRKLWGLLVEGLVRIALGIAIADFAPESDEALPGLLGVAMLGNGLYQGASALVIRYPRWSWFLASGAAHVAFGGLLLLRWREAATWAVPLFLGAAIALPGLGMLRTALRVGRFLRREEAAPAEAAVSYYLEFHVPRRFSERYVSTSPDGGDAPAAPHGDLLVHVWTPTAIAEADGSPNLVSRYVAARDRKGGYAVGHAALQMAPDVYISHCDGNPDAFTGADEVWQTLRSRDNPGVFNESFEEEVAHYPMPTATLRFRSFRADQLRAFWRRYRVVTDYNFTNRNCSVAVSMALEAALVGSLASSRSLAGVLSLLTRSELWVAHFIRWKAREMVWTPGMMLDYARALERLVEAR